MDVEDKTPSGLTVEQAAIIRRWAASTPRVTEVRFFGSRAKGTSRPDSDIDLAATILDDPAYTIATVWMFDVPAWAETVSERLGAKTDLRVYNLSADSRVRQFCDDAGDIVIYRRASSQT